MMAVLEKCVAVLLASVTMCQDVKIEDGSGNVWKRVEPMNEGTLERAMTFNPISLESFDGTNRVIFYTCIKAVMWWIESKSSLLF